MGKKRSGAWAISSRDILAMLAEGAVLNAVRGAPYRDGGLSLCSPKIGATVLHSNFVASLQARGWLEVIEETGDGIAVTISESGREALSRWPEGCHRIPCELGGKPDSSGRRYTSRNCVICVHWRFDVGEPAFGDYSPGEPPASRCDRGHWRLIGEEDDEDSYREKLLTAHKCPDFDEYEPKG
jgi:hypothetical protein